MPAAPLPGNEAERLSTLRSIGVLDTAPEECFDALVRCAALITGCPVSMISLIDAHRQWCKAMHGVDAAHAPRALSFCAHAIHGDALLEVPDATQDPRFADNPNVTGEAHLRYYAGVPLRIDGARIGTLCVFDTVPRQLTATQLDALRALATTACELLQARHRANGFATERQRLLDFARASGDWMWETDARLAYTWISGAIESVVGEPAAALIGRTIADGPQLDAIGLPRQDGATLHSVLQAGEAFSRVPIRTLTASKALIVSHSAVPVRHAEGQLIGWRGTARDVTRSVEAGSEQRAKDLLLHQLSAGTPGVLYQFHRRTDGSGNFQFVNRGMTELYGVPYDELMSDSTRFLKAIHPDDRESLHREIVAHEAALKPLQTEYRVVHEDGSMRWVSSTSSPERLADGSLIWRGLATDITERKKIELQLRASEERWEIAADATGMGIAQIDLATGAMSFDARACVNHGLPHPHPPYTMAQWFLGIHAEDRAAAQATVERAIHETGRVDARFRFVRPDGVAPWLEVVARVKRDPQSQAVSLVGTCRDVTEPVAVDALRRDKETAERASRAKSEFLSRVSHELRTPLNGILGFAQLMAIDRDHVLADEQQRRLDGVQRSGQHLLALVNDVLDIARIEQSDLAQRLAPVNLMETVRTCLVMIQPLASTRGVSFGGLATSEAPTAPCWVLAESRALEQVLMNLLSNAIKYNRVGGMVHLSLSRHEDVVTLGVRDEGAGLSEAQQAQLFQPFNRLGAERRRIDGNGLGLVIARQLTEAMRGHLSVVSREGEGCRFDIELSACNAPSADVPAAPESPADPAPASSRRRTVLYIEDEPLNVLLMQEVFRNSDAWTLHIARDGTQGLKAARSLLPDLALIDINLPDMSGIHIVQQLRAHPATAALHCIALSADAMQEQIAAAQQAGFDDYWTKPIDVARVMRAMAGPLARA